MAKRRTGAKAPTDAPQPTDAAQPTKAKTAKADTLDVVLRRDAQVGDQQCATGRRLARVTLEPGVSLNYLVDAVRNGLAGDQPAVEL
jgi:hypothetical protein